jgi:hypothetical protein
MTGYQLRPCCGTTYRGDHDHACPERGWAALSRLACEITADGWCAAHSTGSRVAWCRDGFIDGPWCTKTTTTPTNEAAGVAAESEMI